MYYPPGAESHPNCPFSGNDPVAVQWYIGEIPGDDEAAHEELFELQDRYYDSEEEWLAAINLIKTRTGLEPECGAYDENGYGVE